MKQKITLIISVFTLTIYSQVRVDSYLHSKLFGTYQHTPVLLPQARLANFTSSALSLSTEKGNLHLAQQPTAQTQLSLNTYGYYKGEKTSFFGDISIERTYQNDKKWSLSYAEVQPDGTMPNPHYYAVSKTSDWNAQQYKVFGGFTTPLFTPHLHLMLAAHYHLGEKYRTTFDPRPKIIHNTLIFDTQLALTFAPNHQIAIGASKGNTDIDNSITFSDSDSHIPMNYQKYLRWQLGYGTFELPTDISTKRQLPHNQASLHYHYTTPQSQWLTGITYEWHTANTYQSNTEYEANQRLMAQLTTNTYQAYTQYLRQLSQGTFRLYAHYNHTQRTNYLALQQGKSYQAQQHNAQLSAHLYTQKENKITESAFTAQYQQAYQKDVLSQTLTDRHSITLQALHSRTYLLPLVQVTPFARLQVRIPTLNTLQNQNIEYHKTLSDTDYAAKTTHLFYNEVVYPDDALLRRTYYTLAFGTDLKYPLKEQLLAIISIHTAYHTTLQGNSATQLFLSLKLNY